MLLNVGTGEFLQIDYQIIFWILMGLNLLFIAIAKTTNQAYISVLFNTAIINRHLVQKTQEELKLFSAGSILLSLTYFFNMAIMFAYMVEREYSVTVLIILGVLLGGAILKWGAMWSLMFVTENKGGVAEHGMNHLIFYQVGGLILTPVLLISHYLPVEIYDKVVFGCLIFAGFLIMLREIQSIGRAIKARVSVLYIILYLCTLELMPLVLIIYALVVNNAGLN